MSDDSRYRGVNNGLKNLLFVLAALTFVPGIPLGFAISPWLGIGVIFVFVCLLAWWKDAGGE